MATAPSSAPATAESRIQNPSPGQDAYIPKKSGDILQAQDWNNMQLAIRDHINKAYEELDILLRKIDEVKKQIEDLRSDSKVLEDRLRTGFQATADSLSNEMRQGLAQKIDRSPPFTFELNTPASFTIERKNNTDIRWSNIVDIISRNTEPPYVSFYHQPPGSDQPPTRYGFIQCGLVSSDGSKILSIMSENGAKVLLNNRDILNEIIKADQGRVEFSASEGQGVRDQTKQIQFASGFFKRVPVVSASLCSLDLGKEANSRLNVLIESVTQQGFTIRLRTWSDTKLYYAAVSWLAFGN